ncbi:RDD family protein [Streptomyces sp. NPDC002851]
MSFGAPNNPYGQPNPQHQQPGYGYPQQGYGYQQPPGQPGYGYPQQQPGYAGYPGGPGGPGQGFVTLPALGTVQLASMGIRFAARLIDGVIIGVIYGILMFAGVLSAIGVMEDVNDCGAYGSPGYDSCVSDATTSAIVVALGVFAVFFVITLLYEWLMISFAGATFGKMAVGIKVVKEDSGLAPGAGGGFVRWIIPQLGNVLCGIGSLLVYLSPFWDNQNRFQGWHDKLAHTLVIKKP